MSVNRECLLFNRKISDSTLGLVTFGNAGIRSGGKLFIKPSGADLSTLSEEEISVIEIQSGELIEGAKPSSDTPTYLEILKAFPSIGAIIHTHSMYATAWAQSLQPIPCIGTTHADYWTSEIPITRSLTADQISDNYEKETGKAIVEKIRELEVDPLDCPGLLVANHGPFTWGATIRDAFKHAMLLDYIAHLALMTVDIDPHTKPISVSLHRKHFQRKHGPDSYYGQG